MVYDDDDLPTGIDFQLIHSKSIKDTHKDIYAKYRSNHWEFDNPLHTENNCKDLIEEIIEIYNKYRRKHQPPLGF